jgi:hypothetical protein
VNARRWPAALPLLAAVGWLAVPARAQVAPSPAPSPVTSPSAAPAPTAAPGSVTLTADLHLTYISQNTSGYGRLGIPESGIGQPPGTPNFIAGTSPAAPLTPYDAFSSAPMTPGNAGESALYLTPTYHGRLVDVAATFGIGYVAGSTTNAAYWGESLIPPLNPHLGSQAIGYAVAFPTAPGQDDGQGFVGSVVSGSIATKDGHARLRGGWFDLAQNDSFVFTQPAYQSAVPSLAILPAESLGDGPPTADWWSLDAGVYPLHGIDFTGKTGDATLELTDAALPSLPGTGARLSLASLVDDHGEGTRYSIDVAHVTTGGAPFPTTILFAQGTPFVTSQGALPFGTVGGQRETIFGLRAAFHAFGLADAVFEYGRSLYSADGVMLPGTGQPGNYYHAGLSKTVRRATVSFDAYKNDPYYATAILPYGAPENVWSVGWSWPGQWLKSNYQLIDNYPVNVDRQGYRIKYQLNGGPFELHASYANFGQIVPITITNAEQTGFVDGFFLPQADNAPTLGRQNQYGLWATWHAAFADVTVDWVEDAIRRNADIGHPLDFVSYVTPEYTVYAARRLTANALVTLGLAEYFMDGEFSSLVENVNFGQREAFAGAELRETARASTLVTLRRSWFAGYATTPGYAPPDFDGTLFLVEQRLKL